MSTEQTLCHTGKTGACPGSAAVPHYIFAGAETPMLFGSLVMRFIHKSQGFLPSPRLAEVSAGPRKLKTPRNQP